MPMYNSQIDPLKEVDENILRRIQELHRDQQRATIGVIAEMTGMTRSSVYTSVRRLEQKGDVEKVAYERARRNDLKLTPSGLERASNILMRHDLVLSWLKRLGIPEDEAENEACHMEHGLTDNTLGAIKHHVDTAMARMAGCIEMPRGGGALAGPPAELMEILQLAGSTEALAKLKDGIVESGGVEACFQQLKLLREAQKNYGGWENLLMALNLLTQMGDFKTLSQLFGILGDGGDVTAFIDLFEKERRVWQNYLNK